MKFSLFLHIESVGRNDDYAALYGEFIDLCKMADDGGFDAFGWVSIMAWVLRYRPIRF